MKNFALVAVGFLLGITALPSSAQAHGGGIVLGFGLGAACCGYYPYYSPYYYGYPTYYAPPPTVVYTTPPVTYVAPSVAPYAAPPALPASQAAAEFTDGHGRTCRNFQTSINGAPVNGTACLQPDGTWRTVGE